MTSNQMQRDVGQISPPSENEVFVTAFTNASPRCRVRWENWGSIAVDTAAKSNILRRSISPEKMLLASLAGSLADTFHNCARADGAICHRIEFRLTLSMLAIPKGSAVCSPISRIKIVVSVEVDHHNDDRLHEIARTVEDQSPVFCLVTNSGVRLETTWRHGPSRVPI